MSTQLHPAVWLCAWSTFALSLQRLDSYWLLLLFLPTVLLSGLIAARAAYRMLKRVRWLLLSIAFLFFFATPGVRMPGMLGTLGVTFEGVTLALEHTLRLLLLLATLAALLEVLGRDGLLTGLHRLMAPLGRHRERLVARLMMTLEFIDGNHRQGRWQEWLVLDPDDRMETIAMATPPLLARDRALLVLLLLVTCGITLL